MLSWRGRLRGPREAERLQLLPGLGPERLAAPRGVREVDEAVPFVY